MKHLFVNHVLASLINVVGIVCSIELLFFDEILSHVIVALFFGVFFFGGGGVSHVILGWDHFWETSARFFEDIPAVSQCLCPQMLCLKTKKGALCRNCKACLTNLFWCLLSRLHLLPAHITHNHTGGMDLVVAQNKSLRPNVLFYFSLDFCPELKTLKYL